MWKIATLMWILAGSVIAGVAVMIVVVVPSLSQDAMRLIPIAGIGGYLAGIPVAIVIARMILAGQRNAGTPSRA